MNRKQMNSYAKRYFIAVGCAIPILVLLDIWLIPIIGNGWVIVLDCALIVLAFGVALMISRAWTNHITKKRTELLTKKEQQKRAEKLDKISQNNQEAPEIKEQPQKIVQKQKKNYLSVKQKRK